jgi:hypothetical protein
MSATSLVSNPGRISPFRSVVLFPAPTGPQATRLSAGQEAGFRFPIRGLDSSSSNCTCSLGLHLSLVLAENDGK